MAIPLVSQLLSWGIDDNLLKLLNLMVDPDPQAFYLIDVSALDKVDPPRGSVLPIWEHNQGALLKDIVAVDFFFVLFAFFHKLTLEIRAVSWEELLDLLRWVGGFDILSVWICFQRQILLFFIVLFH
jgi:hypothetical protein